MKKEELLKNTYIGEVDTDLEKQEIERREIKAADFFVTHRKLDEVLEEKKGLIFGMKGAGKTNILQFLSEHASGRGKDVDNIILVELDVEEFVKTHPIFSEAAKESDRASLRAIWWDLLAWTVLHSMYYKHHRILKGHWLKRTGRTFLAICGWRNEKFIQNQMVKRTLRAYDMVEPHILVGPIINFLRKIKKVGLDASALSGGVPVPVPSIEFHDAGPNPAPDHPADVLKTLDRILESNGRQLWILMDNAEAAVDYNLIAGRKLALEALVFDIYIDNLSKGTYRGVRLKLFSRWDMILRLDDENKQRLYDRSVLIEWKHKEVVRLLLKRLLANEGIQAIVQDDAKRDYRREINGLGEEDLRKLFNRIFSGPSFVAGDKDLYDYIGSFFLDGHNTIQPRYIIFWCKEIIEYEKEANPEADATLPLFSEKAIKVAFARVSAFATRKDYGWPYPEFEDHRQALVRFLAEKEEETWCFENKELRHLFRATPDPKGGDAVSAFWAIGLFRQDEGRLPEDSEHSTIPLLFRQGLRPSHNDGANATET